MSDNDIQKWRLHVVCALVSERKDNRVLGVYHRAR